MRVRFTRAVTTGVAAALLAAGAAQTVQAATPELSTSAKLADKRQLTSGTRAYAVGFQDGLWHANGWHITGEMGGVWTPPMKLLDGVWFGVDGTWTGPATTYTSGWGYSKFTLPDVQGLQATRTDLAPDGRRGMLFGLTLSNPGSAEKTVTVQVDAHSELMGAWPWGEDASRNPPSAKDNLPDTAAYDGARGALTFTDKGTLPGGAAHDYAALVASDRTPSAQETGKGYHGPQPGTVCTGKETPAPMPSACDDGPYGNGAGGRLSYKVTVPANGSETVWVAAAGSDRGLAAARGELKATLGKDPDAALKQKIASRRAVDQWSQVSLPGDKLLQDAVAWGKQNLADSTQTATDLKIRWTDQGKQFPAPLGTVKKVTFFGAGFPDYPWLFGTDGEYTSFAAMALGQFETAEDHLRALRDVSDVLNDRSGLVTHEVVTDGSVYFGHDSQRTADDGTKTNDFNTDETIKFPSAVALVWRWTGDDRFRDEMYDFSKRNLKYVQARLDTDGDGWLEGSGNVERSGMGPEKLDNAVYYIRGLFDLADMARSKDDSATARWASGLGRKLLKRFEARWWYPAASQYADSLSAANEQIFQKHWIGQTAMEAELTRNGKPVPGVASHEHGDTALAVREGPDYSGPRPGNPGLFHTGRGGDASGQGVLDIFGLTTSIQSVGEGNYGRMGAGEQQRYTDALAETMFGEPAQQGEPDEQPGAMPEIFPSETKPGGNTDSCWTCRSMVMQAWGHYGTAWPVIHQQLGVAPDLGRGHVAVVPQIPDGQPSVQGSKIRLGKGWIDVQAARDGDRLVTRVDAGHTPGDSLAVGAVLPRGTHVGTVRLDGRTVRRPHVRLTNRGLEVTVAARPSERHTVTVDAG